VLDKPKITHNFKSRDYEVSFNTTRRKRKRTSKAQKRIKENNERNKDEKIRRQIYCGRDFGEHNGLFENKSL